MNWLFPWRWPLRRKLVAIVLLILIFPVSLVGLLRSIEDQLVQTNEEKLLAVAEVSSLPFRQHPEWFSNSARRWLQNAVGVAFHVFPLNRSPIVDGYFTDWQEFESYRQIFPGKTGSLGVLTGSFDQRLYLSLYVKDDSWLYGTERSKNTGDQIEIDFYEYSSDSELRLTSLKLAPQAPGPVPVLELRENDTRLSLSYFAVVSEVTDGVNIEVKVPARVKPVGIAIRWQDKDSNPRSSTVDLISTARFDMNPVIWPKLGLLNYVKQLDIARGRRLTLLDNQGRILARAGSLQSPSDGENHWLLRKILTNTNQAESEVKDSLKLSSPVIFGALKGQGSSHYQRNSIRPRIEASWPIKSINNQQIMGILLLEENTAPIQITQSRIIADSLRYFVIVFGILLILLLWYAGKLSRRLMKLTQIVKQAVDDDGRLLEIPDPERISGHDEIAELYAGFHQMSKRLAEYNDYLENLASRLSHELRTPVAIVRSSLDNLKFFDTLTEEQEQALNRAIEGNQRLSEIISRMRQASSIKTAMQSSEKQQVELIGLLNHLIEGYAHTWPQQKFQLHADCDRLALELAVDLFVEMLDKIIGNAVDFTTDGSAIEIDVKKGNKVVTLSIFNKGPLIPKKNLMRIFNSMVSVRHNGKSGSNLGLGLYVARLIAEFHQGTIKAQNRENKGGVAIVISLPLV